jgi:hypothetical protein
MQLTLHNLTIPFLEIDDKGGEISHKDNVGERDENGKGSIKF